MSNEYNLKTTDFSSLIAVSKKLFEIIHRRLNVSTTYITRRGETAMTVLSSFNEQEEIIPEGYSVEYSGTYCRLILTNPDDVMTTMNLTKDEITKQLEVTDQLKVKGFLGVSLFDLEGNVFGTLCVMDKEEKEFDEEDIQFLKSMADVLSHLIELDQTKYNMSYLNVPIIPITKGISILSVQGIIDQSRGEKILQTVLNYASEEHVEHFLLDVSGLIILDGIFPRTIIELAQALQLMGIQTFLTGVTPQIAIHEVDNQPLKHLNVKTVSNPETALKYIGFTIKKSK
ncbi:STAS domain-containing protein [Alkalihalophilus sp. As8PL]|uniref:STAS domain-containing protein n=1 Tax=Alkalihalophilus sp. As8PL TaxID=3237103 RepID=A0AB39BUZ8_9BACI